MKATDPAGPTLRARGVLRFGLFELDPRSGDLRRNGLKLAGQPFQVLVMLLERPGEAVAREDLQKRLWPADTFVDFDHSLNTAINKIREALGDSAENPRFVETLPRRGYRFIAPVDVGAGLVPALSPADVAPVPAGHPEGVPLPTRWGLRLAAMLAMLLVGTAVAWYAWERSRPKPELIERRLTTNSSELAVRAAAISPDGRYLAYADDSGIHLKVIDTAETHDLPTPAGSRIYKLAWFPDGNKLLASAELEIRDPLGTPSGKSSLWTVSILGGTPRKLRDGGSDGSVFQDGVGIVFVSAEGKEIWQTGPEGEEPRKLITASEEESFAIPAVAKGRLWYERLYEQILSDTWAYKIESCDLKGGPPTLLLSASGSSSAAVLLPDGRLIYSRIDQPHLYQVLFQGCSLWEVRADLRTGLPRSEPRRIAAWPLHHLWGLSATADGKRLAFLKKRTDLWSVYVGDVEGNGLRIVNPRRLTLSESWDHAYAWTPDSKSILFDSNRNGTWDIFRQALEEHKAETLVASPGGSIRPAMSPDGASVLYLVPQTDNSYHRPHKIIRVALTGGPPQSLGEIQSVGDIRCARTANLCVVTEAGLKQWVLYALDPAKGKGRELLRTGPVWTPGGVQYWDVSPDGSSLAFLKGGVQKEALQIQVRPLAGGASRELDIGKQGPPKAIRWSGDGKGWYVTTWSTSVGPGANAQILLKVDPTGKSQQPIKGSRWSDPIPSPDGRHVAMMGLVLTSNVWMLENF